MYLTAGMLYDLYRINHGRSKAEVEVVITEIVVNTILDRLL